MWFWRTSAPFWAHAYAVDQQRLLAERSSTRVPTRRVELRMGVNLNEVHVDRNDHYSDGANVIYFTLFRALSVLGRVEEAAAVAAETTASRRTADLASGRCNREAASRAANVR